MIRFCCSQNTAATKTQVWQ